MAHYKIEVHSRPEGGGVTVQTRVNGEWKFFAKMEVFSICENEYHFHDYKKQDNEATRKWLEQIYQL